MDIQIFNYINELAGRWAVLDVVGVFCATYLIYILIGGTVVLAFFPAERVRHWRRIGRIALAAAVGSYGIFKIIFPFFFHRARPFAVLDGVTQLIASNPLEVYRSFPSGHALAAFAIAYTVWLYDKKPGRWFLAGAVLVSIARVFVGVHWPSDVLAGAALGILGAYAARRVVALLPVNKMLQ